MTTATPGDSTSLSIGFDAHEDRLFLTRSPAGPAEALLLTRRLTARLINGIATVLERSSIPASRAPDEMRNDIILMEHQGALVKPGQSGKAAGAVVQGQQNRNKSQAFAGRLVKTVDLTVNPRSFQLVFHAQTGEPMTLALNRFDLHRMIEVIKRQAERAGWNLQIDASWLGDDQSQLTMN